MHDIVAALAICSGIYIFTRLMLCPLRNMFRKTHESSRKPIKTTSLKPGDGITLMRILDLSSKIPETTVLYK
jgi:hypothetical protein